MFHEFSVFLIKSNECSQDSYIGLADFFFAYIFLKKKSLNFFFRAFRLKFRAVPLLNVRQTPLSNSKSVKVAKNVIDF